MSAHPAETARSLARIVRLSVADPRLARLIRKVSAEHLTYLSVGALVDLAQVIRAAEKDQVNGLVIEAGTALGGSAIVMAAAKAPVRPMRAYDMFGMIPPPTSDDGEDVHARYEEIMKGKSRGLGGELYDGYRDDLLGEVGASFARHGVAVDENSVTLVQGAFQETLCADSPVAVAHLDGDWYESTLTCLECIVPYLAPGGRLVIDDYDHWSGCRKAIDEFFADRQGFVQERWERLHIVKQ